MTKGKIFWGLGFILLGVLLLWLYKHSPRKVEFLGHYHKIGVHRANTLEKQERALLYFDALELDIVYMPETNILDIHHPPAPSSGLTFKNYVTALGVNQPFLWLDIKNLNKENAELILQKLNAILHPINYPKHNILIETRFPENLAIFAEEGYKTSYYLKQNLYKLNEGKLHSEIAHIKTILNAQPTLGISTEHLDYQILKDHFPTKTKYLWCIRHSKFDDYSLIRTMLKDETVALVLTRYSPL